MKLIDDCGPKRCKAITRSGSRCKRVQWMSRPGLCTPHRLMELCGRKRCKAIGKVNGLRCKRTDIYRGLCPIHRNYRQPVANEAQARELSRLDSPPDNLIPFPLRRCR